MGTGSKNCPKCSGRMDEGSLLGKDTYGGNLLSKWVEGKPEKSMWTGLKIKGLKVLSVVAYRCTRCGYLENYAEG